MARRRLIDPRIWDSGHFKRLRSRQRLLWIGLITIADDEGKLRGEPEVVKAEIFPFDTRLSPREVAKDLQVLQEEGLIDQYETSGDRYIAIPKWQAYQKPSHPTPSRIPNPPIEKPNNSGAPPEILQSASREPHDQGSVVKGSVGKDSVVKETENFSSSPNRQQKSFQVTAAVEIDQAIKRAVKRVDG